MPMYAFHCPECGHEFELFLRPSEALKGAQCPACAVRVVLQADDGPATAPGAACDLFKKT